MADPYWRYSATSDLGSVPKPNFHGYLSSEASASISHQLYSSTDLRGHSSDYLQKEILTSRPGAYGLDDTSGIGVHREPGFEGFTAGASIKGYPSPLGNSNLLSKGQDVTPGVNTAILDVIDERNSSMRNIDGLSGPGSAGESNILFVDGLPTDCTRREVGHLFRPFIGYKEIRVVHKEPRRSGDQPMVLCFVEFNDAKCALTALEALQGYKFDDKKPESPSLKIHFAHFPFQLPSDRHDKQQVLRPHRTQ